MTVLEKNGKLNSELVKKINKKELVLIYIGINNLQIYTDPKPDMGSYQRMYKLVQTKWQTCVW